jgi:uncharacterized membrane protein
MEGRSSMASIDLENGVGGENIQKNIIIPEEKISSNILNCCLVISILLLIGPFIVLDVFYFYYSYYGGECENKKDDFGLTIDQYLLGQAISILITIIFLITVGIFLYICKDAEKFPYQIITYPMTIFSITWLVIGCIVYWTKTDTDTCTKEKNTFILVTLIISIVGTFTNLCINGKGKKK